MAYIPPHKRLSKNQEESSPTPELLVPKFKKILNVHSSSSARRRDKHISVRNKIIYAVQSISRWLAVPLTEDGQLPSSVHLVPVSLESIERKAGEKPMTLVDDHSQQECNAVEDFCVKGPWESTAKNVHVDLLTAFQNVKNEMDNQSLEEIKPTIVARFGRVLFHRNPSLTQDSVKKGSISESSLKHSRRMFYTNVPISYMEYVKTGVVSKLGLCFEEEKELYHVKLADSTRPDSTISCKCRVPKGEKKLELYKIELNQVRHLVADVSCLYKNVDLRLMLCTKRIITALTDEEQQNIIDLIGSAILDPKLKGGLRWPLGKANSGARYSIVGVWHMKAEAYSSSSMRLKLREADRFDFLTSTGEVTREIVLKLTGLTRKLLEGSEAVDVLAMLEGAVKLIWDHFLCWDGRLVTYCEP